MRKSKVVHLVLITSLVSACEQAPQKSLFLRSDTTARYSRRVTGNSYVAFRPYGYYSPSGTYIRSGYHSIAISERANVGANTSKTKAIRGGFGRSAMKVSS
ncbi:MAG TPA: hypothetical protein VEC36_12145 [Patescibacteria group bacterium]|nr:hypothetical protein [Patescibacteria group bacterium]